MALRIISPKLSQLVLRPEQRFTEENRWFTEELWPGRCSALYVRTRTRGERHARKAYSKRTERNRRSTLDAEFPCRGAQQPAPNLRFRVEFGGSGRERIRSGCLARTSDRHRCSNS